MTRESSSRGGAGHGRRSKSATTKERPETVEAALALALRHARNATAEALLAGHALLDAASLAVVGRPVAHGADRDSASEAVRALARAVDGLDALAERLRADDPDATRRLVEALLAALDAEIARWERAARDDPDARAVLRAFLGLRELLWELGLRPRSESAPGEPSEPPPPPQGRAESRAPDPAASGRTRRRPPRSESAQAATGSRAPRRRRVQRVDVER